MKLSIKLAARLHKSVEQRLGSRVHYATRAASFLCDKTYTALFKFASSLQNICSCEEAVNRLMSKIANNSEHRNAG